MRQEGRRLVVELRGKKSFGITISIGDFNFGNGSNMRVRARVPHGSTPVLSTAAADMKVRGRVQSLEVKSASGDLVVNGEIERDAEIKTVSGDVRLGRVGGELRVQTVSGDVNAQSVGGSVVSKTVSGDVRFESVREGHVTAQSVSGDIELGVAAGTNLDVDAGSVSGDLASEVPLGSDPDALGGDGPDARRPGQDRQRRLPRLPRAVAVKRSSYARTFASCSRASRSRCSATGR